MSRMRVRASKFSADGWYVSAVLAVAIVLAGAVPDLPPAASAQARFIATYSFKPLHTTAEGGMVLLRVEIANDSDDNALNAVLQVVNPQDSTIQYGAYERSDIHRRQNRSFTAQFMIPAAELERWADGGHPAFVLQFYTDSGQPASVAVEARRKTEGAP